MASKKSKKKRAALKIPKQITGKDAFVLSFVARNGRPTADQRKEIEAYLTPHVVTVAFSGLPKGRSAPKKGQKTLAELRRLGISNATQVKAKSASV